MTPQERQLIDDLFDRLSTLEGAPRDPDAAAAIAQGLRDAPNAVYALVQTVLLQDEALRNADSRIQELEARGEQHPPGGFLDSMRESILGPNSSRGSVPNVRPPDLPNRPTWNSGQVLQQTQNADQYNQESYGRPAHGQPPYGGQPAGAPQAPMGAGGPMGSGGSFLGTAAAAAAGMVGGSLLLGSIRSMMGGGGTQQSFGNTAGLGGGSPKPGEQSGSDLARDAGINDIGSSGQSADAGSGSRAGLFDTASNDGDHDDMDLDSDDFGDSDYA